MKNAMLALLLLPAILAHHHGAVALAAVPSCAPANDWAYARADDLSSVTVGSVAAAGGSTEAVLICVGGYWLVDGLVKDAPSLTGAR